MEFGPRALETDQYLNPTKFNITDILTKNLIDLTLCFRPMIRDIDAKNILENYS